MSKSKFKYWLSFIALSVLSSTASEAFSQDSFEEFRKEANALFELYRKTTNLEFERYRQKVNQEFAEYMQQEWAGFDTKPAVPLPPSPEPPSPLVAPIDEKSLNIPFPFSDIQPTIPIPSPPEPLLPKDNSLPELPFDKNPASPKEPRDKGVVFDFYGNSCEVPFDKSLQLSLRGVDEKSVALGWQSLAGKESIPTIKCLVALRDKLQLPDWGYVLLVEKFADKIFPNKKDESRLLQMFLLTQSGYKVRIGRLDDQLIILVPCNETIYNYRYIPIDGTKYYVLDPTIKTGRTFVYNREFPGEQSFSMNIVKQPDFSINPTPARRFKSTGFSLIEANVSTNKNLIDFYQDYPRTSEWNIHANAGLSDYIKGQLYPVLQERIEGKTKHEAANILLNFVQTGFGYKTDEEQFGAEKAFFADESFYFPFNDCEDRAILYANLIRDLLGLDVVLVHYPGHLATAVALGDDSEGDYFEIDGQKYIVCDPTYINSRVGMAMRQYKDSSATIIRL